MESKYISIAEYAKRQGVSKSYVYSLIKLPEYQPYISERNGRKLVLESMLIDNGKKDKKPEESTSIQLELEGFTSIPEESDKKPVEEAQKPAETHGKAISADKDLIEYYKKRIETLESIVADKDRQLQENTATISLLLERQQELTEKALQVATQAQYLQALPQKKQGFFRRLLGIGRKEE